MQSSETPKITRELAHVLGVSNAQWATLHLAIGDVPRMEVGFIPGHPANVRSFPIDPAALAAVPFVLRLEMQPSGKPEVPAQAQTYRVRIYADTRGEWRFRIVAGNGRIVADSAEGYARRAGAHRAAEALMGARLEIEPE